MPIKYIFYKPIFIIITSKSKIINILNLIYLLIFKIQNDGNKSLRHRKKHKSRGKKKSTTDNNIRLHQSPNEVRVK